MRYVIVVVAMMMMRMDKAVWNERDGPAESRDKKNSSSSSSSS